MPESETDVQAAGSSAAGDQDVSAAGSSTAEGENEPSLVDIVSKALGPEESPASEGDGGDASAEAEPSTEPEKDGKEDLPDDPTEEELKAAAPHTRARIEKLLDQRRGLHGQVEELTPKAEQWDKIENFRKANNLTPEKVANAIQITALIENQPEKAYHVVRQLFQTLAERTGALLPSDLQEAVKSGEITQERARELSEARARAQLSETGREREAQRRQQDEESRTQEQRLHTVRTVATDWDRQKLSKDPDWTLKRQAVAKNFERRLIAEGLPATEADVRKILDEEAAMVESLVGSFKPKPRAVTPTPAGGSARGSARPAPKDHYDVVTQALG